MDSVSSQSRCARFCAFFSPKPKSSSTPVISITSLSESPRPRRSLNGRVHPIPISPAERHSIWGTLSTDSERSFEDDAFITPERIPGTILFSVRQ